MAYQYEPLVDIRRRWTGERFQRPPLELDALDDPWDKGPLHDSGQFGKDQPIEPIPSGSLSTGHEAGNTSIQELESSLGHSSLADAGDTLVKNNCTIKNANHGDLSPVSEVEGNKRETLRTSSKLHDASQKEAMMTEEPSEATTPSVSSEGSDEGNEFKKPRGDPYTLRKEEWSIQQDSQEDHWDMIRLIILHPGEFSDPLQCEIQHTYIMHEPVKDILNCPPHPLGQHTEYEALSYTWGTVSDQEALHIGDSVLEIRANLATALKHLRHPTRSRTLWIDAICIDQKNIEERNVQVLRMRQIYRESKQVLIWLGEKSHNSNLAIDLLESIGGKEEEMELEEMFSNWIDGESMILRPRDATQLRGPEDFAQEDWQALADLLYHRDWWSRIWIVQEATYPQKARLICGERDVPWDTLQNFFEINRKFDTIWDKGWFSEPVRLAKSLVEQRIQTQFHELFQGFTRDATTLESLVTTNSGRKRTDPRDMIYAVLGLASCPTFIQVDYSKSVEEVYIEAAKEMIAGITNEEPAPKLDLIWSAHRSFEVSEMKLPSWVPNWSTSSDFMNRIDVELGDPYNLKKGFGPMTEPPVIDEHNVLFFSGICVGKIVRVTEPLLSELGVHWEHTMWEPENLTDGVYPTGENPIDAFWRTLVSDQGNIVGKRLAAGEIEKYRDEFLIWSGRKERAGKRMLERHERWSGIYDCLSRKMLGYVFAETSTGHFAVVPVHTSINDLICIGRGLSLPIILRPVSGPTESGVDDYEVVGPAYVHGIMDGEFMANATDSDLVDDIFRII